LLNVSRQFGAGVPEFDAVFSVQCTLYSPQLLGGRGCVSNSRTLASNRLNTAGSKYADDIYLLISQYLISASNRGQLGAADPEIHTPNCQKESVSCPKKLFKIRIRTYENFFLGIGIYVSLTGSAALITI
jgi:hypothetical protein